MNVPDAGEPMGSQSEDTHQQDQHGRPVLDVVVQFTGDPTQTQEPDDLQGAEQAADALRRETREETETDFRNNFYKRQKGTKFKYKYIII